MDGPKRPPKILVAPLDWGLGHATRCIPIVRELLAAGFTVLLAGSGKVKALLTKEFPQLRFVDLPGYEITYAATSWGLPFKIVAQIPKLISAINREHRWLQKLAEKESIDAVISDNRYGLRHPKIFSVVMTHQLRIKTPFNWLEDALQRLNYIYLNRFNEVWVPDREGQVNLAGELSHPKKKPLVTVQYLGALSRFCGNGNDQEKHLLVVLSGPEPQRTLLENLVVAELKDYTKPVVLVRGLPQGEGAIKLPQNVAVHTHLATEELACKMKQASFVISRCGYSTVMDVAALKKKCILIPTPGQTEQEYLAAHLMKNNFALCIAQKKFRLLPALELGASFFYKTVDTQEPNVLPEAINHLIKIINQRKML